MKIIKSSPLLAMLIGFIIIAAAISTISVEGRKHHVKRIKPKHRRHSRDTPTASPAPAPYPSTHDGVFDILSFGAKGDGISDDSKVRTNIIHIFLIPTIYFQSKRHISQTLHLRLWVTFKIFKNTKYFKNKNDYLGICTLLHKRNCFC